MNLLAFSAWELVPSTALAMLIAFLCIRSEIDKNVSTGSHRVDIWLLLLFFSHFYRCFSKIQYSSRRDKRRMSVRCDGPLARTTANHTHDEACVGGREVLNMNSIGQCQQKRLR